MTQPKQTQDLVAEAKELKDKSAKQAAHAHLIFKHDVSPMPSVAHPFVQGTTGLIDPIWAAWLNELRDAINQR